MKYFSAFLKLFFILLVVPVLWGCAEGENEKISETASQPPDEVRIVSVSPSTIRPGIETRITVKFTCRLNSRRGAIIHMGFNGVDVKKVLSRNYRGKKIGRIRKVSASAYELQSDGSVANDSFKLIDRDRYLISKPKLAVIPPEEETGGSENSVKACRIPLEVCSGDIITTSESITPIYNHSSDDNQFQVLITLSEPDQETSWTPLAYDTAPIKLKTPPWAKPGSQSSKM